MNNKKDRLTPLYSSYPADTVKDVGFPLLIPVRSDSQVNLLRCLIRLESLSYPENGVGRPTGNGRPDRFDGSGSGS